MKKFKFRYESVLKMRQDAEDRIKNTLAAVISERQKKVNAYEAMCEKEALFQNHITESLQTGNAKGRHLFYDGQQYYAKHKKRISEDISQLDKDIEIIKIDLTHAMKERKVMEKLKEKAFQDFIEAIEEADAKVIEEIVNYHNNRKEGH